MRAVVKYALGEGHIELRDVPEPEVGADEVKIKVKAVKVVFDPEWPPGKKID